MRRKDNSGSSNERKDYSGSSGLDGKDYSGSSGVGRKDNSGSSASWPERTKDRKRREESMEHDQQEIINQPGIVAPKIGRRKSWSDAKPAAAYRFGEHRDEPSSASSVRSFDTTQQIYELYKDTRSGSLASQFSNTSTNTFGCRDRNKHNL
ncbi:hypothetical protein BT69DRAFT_1137533 [Atractiella rhizophila]|nr:hypothetical protein BT69DRAFT_1137533 [Atractiella rhizophila]